MASPDEPVYSSRLYGGIANDGFPNLPGLHSFSVSSYGNFANGKDPFDAPPYRQHFPDDQYQHLTQPMSTNAQFVPQERNHLFPVPQNFEMAQMQYLQANTMQPQQVGYGGSLQVPAYAAPLQHGSDQGLVYGTLQRTPQHSAAEYGSGGGSYVHAHGIDDASIDPRILASTAPRYQSKPGQPTSHNTPPTGTQAYKQRRNKVTSQRTGVTPSSRPADSVIGAVPQTLAPDSSSSSPDKADVVVDDNDEPVDGSNELQSAAGPGSEKKQNYSTNVGRPVPQLRFQSSGGSYGLS